MKVCAICFLILCLSGLPLSAASSDILSSKTVRVGYFELGNCMTGASEDAQKSGYAYDLLCEISRFANWDIEFVYGSFSDLLAMVKKGEIDVLPCVDYTDERAGELFFTQSKTIDEYYTIATYQAQGNAGIRNAADLNGFRIATVIDSYQNVLYEQWAEENGISNELVYCDSFDDLWNLVLDGKADYVLNINTINPPVKIFNLFNCGSCISYFAVSKNCPEIVTEIDDAVALLEKISPFMLTHLKEKYFGNFLSSFDFTDAEVEWLSSHDSIKIGGFTNDSPYAFYDSNGKVCGVYPDMIDLIFERLDLNLSAEWVLYDTIQELRQALSDGEIDIIGEEYHSYYRAQQSNEIISEEINSVPMGLLAKANVKPGTRSLIAVASTRHGAAYAEDAYSDADFLYCNSVPECVAAVADGSADFAIAHTSVLQQFSRGYKQFFSITPINYTCSICFSSSPHNIELINILNRGIHLIQQEDRSQLEMKYVYEENTRYTMQEFFNEYTWLFLLISFVFIAIIFIAINRFSTSRKLMAANSYKTMFLNSMSHDIRTPMNAIVGFTSLAEKNINNKDKVKEYLGKITTSSNHLLNLINDILEMSRIESGKVQLENTSTNLPALMGDLKSILFSGASAKKQTLIIDSKNVKDEYILADKLKLNQILLNLAGNAVKYTPNGGIILVKVTQIPCIKKDFATYVFTVKDNGIGMSREFQEHIFESFVREETATKSGIQGTGLGMSITKNLIDMMGGTISVDSEKGKGTEFRVTLTFRLSAPKIEIEEDIDITQFKGKKILLVEDNEFNQEIGVEVLTDAGFEVTVADDGDKAVEAVRNMTPGQFDLVLMDVQMPTLDGYMATRQIRTLRNQEAANIPIIAMTANAFEEDRHMALESGMNGFLTKPIVIRDLFSQLKAILN